MAPRGPIFIGGTGRSGTTVLVRLLSRHPEIFSLRWESQFLVAPNGLVQLAERRWPRHQLQGFVERMRGRWYERVVRPGQPNEYTAGLLDDVPREDLDAAIDMLLARAPESRHPQAARALVADFTRALFDPAAERAGAHRWCEKTPRNVLFANKLQQSFPDMRMLHIIRDGRDVVASMLQRGFWPIASGHEFSVLRRYRGEVTFEAAVGYWRDVIDLARLVAADLPEGCYHEVRFEDLVEQPEPTAQAICEFLGEEYSPRLLDQDLSRHHIGRWRKDLTPAQQETFAELAGDALAREGYGP